MKHAYHGYMTNYFSDHLVIAYFFNARGESLERTPIGMLRSIVYQLLKSDDSLYQSFVHRFREKQRTAPEDKCQWHPSELKDFIRSAIQLSHSNRPILIHIDAIDECDDSDVHGVVGYLESLSIHAVRDNIPFKICLSSRHYPSVRMRQVVELAVDESKNHQADISIYVRENLRTHTHDLATEILNKADGIFLWVVIVVSLLNKACDEGRPEGMRETLQGIPAGLESMFSSILNRGSSDLTETTLLLQWVLLSESPLEPHVLYAAVVGDEPPSTSVAERRIIHSSRGLLQVRKDKRNVVQFIHQSVSDFLVRPKQLQKLDPTLGSDPIQASHGRLWEFSQSCIEHMITLIAAATDDSTIQGSLHPFIYDAPMAAFYHAEMALSAKALGRDKSSERVQGNDCPASLFTPNQLRIKQWVRESDRWFMFWKGLASVKLPHVYHSSVLNFTGDETLLYVYTCLDLPNLVSLALNQDNVNSKCSKYGTALQAACYKSKIRVVKLLLEKGADVNARVGRYGTALQIACYKSNPGVVELLLKKGAYVNAPSGRYGTALQAACSNIYPGVFQLLVEKGAVMKA